MTDASADWAAWVQAFGTIAAVLGAAWPAARDARETRRREEQQLRQADLRAAQALRASRAAALNLALLAIERVRELHALLRDEARRDRISWGAPSRTLLVTGSRRSLRGLRQSDGADRARGASTIESFEGGFEDRGPPRRSPRAAETLTCAAEARCLRRSS